MGGNNFTNLMAFITAYNQLPLFSLWHLQQEADTDLDSLFSSAVRGLWEKTEIYKIN